MARLINIRLTTMDGGTAYVNPFFVKAILPYNAEYSSVRINGVSKLIVLGTPEELYDLFYTSVRDAEVNHD